MPLNFLIVSPDGGSIRGVTSFGHKDDDGGEDKGDGEGEGDGKA